MNSFELNKVLGAVLGTSLVLLALNIGADAIFSPEKPAKPGYEIAVKETGAEKAAPQEKSEPIAVLLASASAERGLAAAKQCAACHTFEKGGPNRVGPNLYDIVGRAVASVPGFAYSDAMKGKGGEWTFDELSAFLHDPRAKVPGTKMTYAGIKRDQQRADLIEYMRAQSDSPKPVPKVAAAPAAGGKPADAAPAAPKANAAPAAAPAAPAAQPPAPAPK